MEGNFTSLPMTDELCCHIAALYGRGFAKQKLVCFGAADAKDVALRCAYYGCGDINETEMRAGYERDKEVYVFAATFNSNIIFSRKLRTLFEQEQLGGSDLSKLYLKHFASVKKERPYIGEPLSDELKEEARSEDPNTARLERIEATMQAKFSEWSSQLHTLMVCAFAVAIGLALAHWFGK